MNGTSDVESSVVGVDFSATTEAARRIALQKVDKNVAEAHILRRVAAHSKVAAEAVKVNERPVSNQDWQIPGFGTGARVQTSFGLVPVEALRVGDPIKTKAGQFLRVEYVDTIRLDRRFLLTHPEAQPISIPKGAFGPSCPGQNICVSGAQAVRLPNRFDQMRGKAAVELIGQWRVARKLTGCFNYYIFHCGEVCIACIDGLWVDIEPVNPDTSIE